MAGLTADGFVAKTFEEIRADFEAQQREKIDENLDTTDFSLVGQFNGIFATALAEVWELAEELHDAFDPDKATGVAQDTLYSLTDTLRRRAQKSTVLATVVLNAGTNIPKGDAQASVDGNAAAKFVNDEPMVNAGGATASRTVRFVALQTGAVLANAGTLTVIDTPISGWTSITNAEDATLGAVIELDSFYRLRRLQEIARQGGGTVPGLKADLQALDTVRAAIVLENDTDYVVGTMPPHSVEAVVRSAVGADDAAEIASTIWTNKSGGTRTVGTELVVHTDSEGFTHTVRFSRPVDRNVTILLRLTKDLTLYVGDIAAKSTIVSALEDPTNASYHDVSSDVFAGRIVSEAMKIAGVLNAEARVSFSSSTWESGLAELPIGEREIAAFDTSRVSISAIP